MDNFFYNLNKKMSDLAKRQDLAESAVAERDMGKHNNATTGFKALAKKAGAKYGSKAAGERVAGAQFQKMKKAGQLENAMNEATPIPYSDDQIANVDQYRKERGIQAPTERNADLYPEEADYESKQIAARVNDAIVKATGKPGTYYKFKRYESQMTKDPSYDLLTSLFSLTGLTDEQDQSLRQQLSAQGYLIIGKPGSGVLMITQLDRNGRASLNKRGPLQIPAAVSKANGIAEGACSKCAPAPCKCNEGNAFSGAVAKAKADGIQKGEKINVGGKTYPVKETDAKKIAPPQRNQDAMSGKQNLKPDPAGKDHPLKNVAKGIKAFVQGKPEPMDEEKTKEPRSKGTAFDPDYQAQAKKEKEGTGNFDKKKISTGTVYTRKHKDDEEDEVKSDQPKKKGRPKSSSGPRQERVTAKSRKVDRTTWQKPVKENDISITDRGEYDDEVGQTKDSLHTIVRHARELENALRGNENMPEWVQEKIGQIKGMMTSVTDYILSTHERDAEQHMEPIAEKSVSQAQARMMAGAAHNPKFAKKVGVATKVAKEFNKADTGKDISRLPKKVKKTEEGAKPDFLDIDGDDNEKETFKKAVADKKEKKVAETTVSGSVATAPAGGKSKGGMQFGKGVYEGAIAESYEKKLNTVLTEAMNVTVTMNSQPNGGPGKTINVTADGEDAEKLAEILKLAGVSGQSSGCSSCGQAPCGCETVDEAYGDTTATKNSPDWPTDTETIDGDDPYLRRFSGGLNGAKSTGQTTIPVIAGQRRRTSTMEENVELERSLFNTWKNYKG